MSYPLHQSVPQTRKFALSALSWSQINDARTDDDTVTFDGLLIEAAFDAASETEPSVAIEKLDALISTAFAMREEIEGFEPTTPPRTEVYAELDADLEDEDDFS